MYHVQALSLMGHPGRVPQHRYAQSFSFPFRNGSGVHRKCVPHSGRLCVQRHEAVCQVTTRLRLGGTSPGKGVHRLGPACLPPLRKEASFIYFLMLGINSRPHACMAGACATELRPPVFIFKVVQEKGQNLPQPPKLRDKWSSCVSSFS